MEMKRSIQRLGAALVAAAFAMGAWGEAPEFAGGARALQALVGGSADMVSGAYEHTINMAAKKQPIKAVVLQAKYSSIALVMSKEKAAKYRNAKDLKGMKV